jgi:hypothetical protein
MIMYKHEEKYCPKCNAMFICKVGDIANCQCTTLQLSDETKSFLSKTHFDCLCKNCLTKINQDIKMTKAYQFPTQKGLASGIESEAKANENWDLNSISYFSN